MILLDTNVLLELMKANPHPGVAAWADAQLESDLFICAITRAEIELGIALLPDGRRKQAIAEAAQVLFEQFADRCLVFGEAAAVQYGQLVAYRTELRRSIAVEDGQIASIALVHGLHLATRNVEDFVDIARLIIVNPWT